MSAVGIIAIVEVALSLADEILKQIPNYDQRKTAKYHKLKKNYRELLLRDHPYRDDNAIDNARDEVMEFVQTFSKDIEWNAKQS